MNTTTAVIQCGIQFCPASTVAGSRRVWFCGAHRWPGGQHDKGVTVLVNGEDARFIDGVTYDVTFSSGRGVKGRVRGAFTLEGSNDSRLRFDIEVLGASLFVAVDPDHIDRVVAI